MHRVVEAVVSVQQKGVEQGDIERLMERVR